MSFVSSILPIFRAFRETLSTPFYSSFVYFFPVSRTETFHLIWRRRDWRDWTWKWRRSGESVEEGEGRDDENKTWMVLIRGRQTVRQLSAMAFPSVLCEFSSPIQCQMSECWSRPCTGHVRSTHTKWDIEVKNGSLKDGETQTNIPMNFSLSNGLGEKKN